MGFDQLSFFDEAEQECDEEVLNIEGHVRHKKKYKDQVVSLHFKEYGAKVV